MLVPKGASFRVRMYRQGLGDCFLLAFPTENVKEPFYMLIDCGVILGTENATKKMTDTAQSIHQATAGRIDVLLATHEHWDHLSGFLQAKEEFEQMKIGSLWLAWTEDPSDALANELRRQRGAALRALQAAQPRFDAMPKSPGEAPVDRLGSRIGELLGFFGARNGQGGNDTASALAQVQEWAEETRYCRPGMKPVALEGTKNVRVYVLGPPQDQQQLKHSDASAGEKRGNVVYHLSQQQAATTSFIAAALDGLAASETVLGKLSKAESMLPFDVSDCYFPDKLGRTSSSRPAKIKGSPKLFATNRPSEAAIKLHRKYFTRRDERWRRIDGDWMEVGAQLALKLDNDTNNTSLAIAVELSDGEVLLFPADAQVGNWTSWQDLSWKVKDISGEREVTASDLLARTVLYKVGHHASHNATLRVGGLESMASDLIALIPVDHKMAMKKRWNMPFPALLRALRERSRGRVMRVDTGVPTEKPKSPPVSLKEWRAFQKATKESTRRFVDYIRYVQ